MASPTEHQVGIHDVELARRASAWDEFVAVQPGAGFMQSSWWPNIQLDNGWGNYGVVIKDGETVVGGAQVLTKYFAPGKSYYYIPEGPVLPQDESDGAQVMQAVMDFIDRKRQSEDRAISHLCIEPRWQQQPNCVSGFRARRRWVEPRTTLYIDLRPDESAILAQMKPKGRYNINVARRHGVSIVEDVSPQGLEDFVRIYQTTIDRHGLDGNKADYYHMLIPRLVALSRGSVFFAEYQGSRIATVLVVYFGERATYFFGGSIAAHRHVMAPYMLHFEIMLRDKKLGCRWYDLYGIAPQSVGADHKWANISVFKRKLGGQDFSFVPSMDYVYDAVAYEAYRQSR